MKKVLIFLLCAVILPLSAEMYPGSFTTVTELKSNQHYLSSGITGNGEKMLVVFSDGMAEYEICLYKKQEGSFIFSGRSLEKFKNGYPVGGYSNGKRMNVSYPFTQPQENDVIMSAEINNDNNSEYFIELSGPSYYGLALIQLSDDKPVIAAEINGHAFIFKDKNGKYFIAGSNVEDYSIFSLTNHTYCMWYVTNDGKFDRKDFLSTELYSAMYGSFLTAFNTSKDFNAFNNLFKFQFANGYQSDAVKWFKKNEKLVKTDKNQQNYLSEIKNYYIQ
ncbi:MAG: hypothetical protein A2015_05735 [Spirochaetes bacterium GWF1_31_7]|nr:MAG: hypothetical protein A2Y30_00145 [Spirochaetes bacterium GWE1_32_154]OHD47192.1 MAG: hypothetical protein A2Y29_10730 [Spirochaetes bacterium GWE2_31_10]OHD48925.1 MAG: hypothetical protein A2015_05735 [Spirochaetes bacterium GWF1_31_7]OHD76567.1 MAG: hypothetical protein A2355_15495 [Spirochaetes bacterium RIFOXYB1_FULL_32_8]HBD92624.1 hypothetical protein [Spirochaetia bacterium]